MRAGVGDGVDILVRATDVKDFVYSRDHVLWKVEGTLQSFVILLRQTEVGIRVEWIVLQPDIGDRIADLPFPTLVTELRALDDHSENTVFIWKKTQWWNTGRLSVV